MEGMRHKTPGGLLKKTDKKVAVSQNLFCQQQQKNLWTFFLWKN